MYDIHKLWYTTVIVVAVDHCLKHCDPWHQAAGAAILDPLLPDQRRGAWGQIDQNGDHNTQYLVDCKNPIGEIPIHQPV